MLMTYTSCGPREDLLQEGHEHHGRLQPRPEEVALHSFRSSAHVDALVPAVLVDTAGVIAVHVLVVCWCIKVFPFQHAGVP